MVRKPGQRDNTHGFRNSSSPAAGTEQWWGAVLGCGSRRRAQVCHGSEAEARARGEGKEEEEAGEC